MISEFFAFLLGASLGYVFTKERLHIESHKDRTLCVYKTVDGQAKLGRLAQRFRLTDEYAVIVPAFSEDDALPFVVGAGRLSFYTRNGEVINEANWKDS